MEHAVADSYQLLKVPSNPAMLAACGNFQEGDSVVPAPSSLAPVPPTCPQCYALIHPGVTTEALAAMAV